jgi:16S rRNA (guanine527-N7)-methyltransferase
MNQPNFIGNKIIADLVERYGGDDREEQQKQLSIFAELLFRWSKSLSLISPGDRPILVEKHIVPALDQLHMLDLVKHQCIMDFGSGAGLPGIPLKIFMPESDFILVESRRRRANYLKEVIRRLGLQRIRVVNRRLEEINPEQVQVDVVVSRAVTHPHSLQLMTRPYLKPHGVIIATSASSERAELEKNTEGQTFLIKRGEMPESYMA